MLQFDPQSRLRDVTEQEIKIMKRREIIKIGRLTLTFQSASNFISRWIRLCLERAYTFVGQQETFHDISQCHSPNAYAGVHATSSTRADISSAKLNCL